MKQVVVAAVLAAISTEELANLATVYNIGRDKAFCELYDRRLDQALKQLSSDAAVAEKAAHVIAKTNLCEATAAGLAILGRRVLSLKLRP